MFDWLLSKNSFNQFVRFRCISTPFCGCFLLQSIRALFEYSATEYSNPIFSNEALMRGKCQRQLSAAQRESCKFARSTTSHVSAVAMTIDLHRSDATSSPFSSSQNANRYEPNYKWCNLQLRNNFYVLRDKQYQAHRQLHHPK